MYPAGIGPETSLCGKAVPSGISLGEAAEPGRPRCGETVAQPANADTNIAIHNVETFTRAAPSFGSR